MKFYDRKDELKSLKASRIQSKKTSCFTVMVGRRRIGKTSLLLESVKGNPALYFFVTRQSEALLAYSFQQEAERQLSTNFMGTASSFAEVFEMLMKYSEQVPFTLIIDEFQELNNVNPAIFGDIRNIWDKNKDKSRINLIACGSIYSMMIRIFEGRQEPLFARQTSKLVLNPFSVATLKEILGDYNRKYTSEDLLCLYLLTGGVAKYVSVLMDSAAVTWRKMLRRVISPDSPFLTEGRDILVSEFGKDYGIYFSVLQLIASGKNTQPEIDSIIGKNTGAYLYNLENEYMLVRRVRPIFSKPGSRNSRWSISDNFLRFWFRYVYPNQMLIEQGRFDLLREIVEKDYEQYSGRVLEMYFRDKIAQQERMTNIGAFWDRKGVNEIDLVAIGDLDKKAVIAEVKRNSKKLNAEVLTSKSEVLKPNLADYEIEYRLLSMENM